MSLEQATSEMPATNKKSSADEDLAVARHHVDAGEYTQAEHICRRVLLAHPNYAHALNLLAEITHRAGAPIVAVALARRAVSLAPDQAAFHLTLGGALLATGLAAEAESALRRALTMAPDDGPTLGKLASTLIVLGRLTDAHALILDALGRNPDDALLHQILGVVLWSLARPEEARLSFLRAGELSPQYFHATSGALFAQHYIPSANSEAIAAEARQWGTKHADKLTRTVVPHRNRPDSDRRLKVAYISGDFRSHPVGRILQSVLPFHDAANVEVYCYSNHWAVDDVTRRLMGAAHTWHSIMHLNDKATADLIRSDAIDILVDLSGHTAEGRLLVLARKPAPVQVMWLGYFDTTGMSAIDYVIADRHVCPSGDERYYVERIARLPDSFLCFTPPSPSPDVAPLPAMSRGYVTFGCQNNVSKVTPDAVAVWSKILRAVPESRLSLKAGALQDTHVRDRFLAMFVRHGIEADRVRLAGGSHYGDYLAAYADIDVALDPFPYNGGHTTLDTLWMGVPVVALRGERFVGRMGASILSTVDLGELIARSPDEYVEKAVALASDLDRLAVLRAGLRVRMAASPLCDGAGIARALETIYREIWQAWCRSVEAPVLEAPTWRP